MKQGRNSYYNHYNNRGDIILQTQRYGSETFQAQYEGFGTRTAQSGTKRGRQGANTKDEETELLLLNEGFRYRDLETGAFLSRDPAGFIDGPNLYAYVSQNPWSKFDPHGLYSLGQLWEDTKKVASDVANKVADTIVAVAEGVASTVIGYSQITFGVGKDFSPANAAQAIGVNIGRSIGLIQSVAEIVYGAGAMIGGGGATLATVGVSSPVSIPVAAAGAVGVAHGLFGVYNGLKLGIEDVGSFSTTRHSTSSGVSASGSSTPSATPKPPSSKTLNRGSTVNPGAGRFPARNLREELAIEEALNNPTAGTPLNLRGGMNDARWPASDGWVKMEQKTNGITVHYVRNTRTGEIDDFKIVDNHVVLPPP